MASYQGHLTFSSVLGTGYACLGAWQLQFEVAPAALGGVATALSGMLPDLDSDSGVPLREMFRLLAGAVPLLLVSRLHREGFSHEEVVLLLAIVYVVVRFGVSEWFKRFTVHRGMFHSIPALLISGLAVYLFYRSDDPRVRLFLAGGTMLGFLSHLVLDELYSVDLMGARLKLNKFAGSALKFWSPSWSATLGTYLLLVLLGFVAWPDLQRTLSGLLPPQEVPVPPPAP